MKEYKQFFIRTFLGCFSAVPILVGLALLSALLDNDDIFSLYPYVAAVWIVAIIIHLIYSLTHMDNYKKLQKIVRLGWENLTEEEMEELAPDENEQNEIKKLNVQIILMCVLFFILLIIDYAVCLRIFGLDDSFFPTFILFLPMAIIWAIPYWKIEGKKKALMSGEYKQKKE